MRLLVVIDSLAQGGAERSLVAIAPGLRARGLDLEVVTLLDRPGLQDDLVRAGAVLHPAVRQPSRVRRVAALRRLIADRRPDLVHTTLFEADIAGRCAAALARRPVVSSLVNTAYGPEHPRPDRLGTLAVRSVQSMDVLTSRWVRRFHAVSTVVADVMATRLRVRRDRIDVVWRGRDPEMIGRQSPERRARARHAMGLPDDALVAVMLSRHERDKGIDTAIEALGLLHAQGIELRLVVAGRTGNETRTLERLVESNGLGAAVCLLGHRDDPIDVLSAGDILLAPSRREGLPGTVLEAMALGVPIVASDLPTIREAVPDDAHARLVPPDDPAELAAAIQRVFDEPGATAARVERARARFERHFTVAAAVDGMVAFYERALTSPKATRS